MPPTVEDRPTDCVKVCESVALARLLWHPLRTRKLAVQVATLGVLCRVATVDSSSRAYARAGRDAVSPVQRQRDDAKVPECRRYRQCQ
jgi:hypothetical protein